jgi:hypothetical protein
MQLTHRQWFAVFTLAACGLALSAASCGLPATDGGPKGENVPRDQQPPPAPQDQKPSPSRAKPAEKKPEPAKPITQFPKAVHGFKGQLQGIIAAVNKDGIVLSDIFGVNREYPPQEPGGLMELRPIERDAPEAWLFGKTIQLLCADNEYKKNYQVGNSIGGMVHWSEKDQALVITGAQWYGRGMGNE